MNSFKINYEVVAVANSIEIQAVQDSRINNILAQNRDIIDKIWQKVQEEKGKKLFNGTLLNFVSVNQEKERIKILGHFIEYKQFLAQQKQPDLRLGIKPIGVSGIIVLGNKGSEYVLFAKRADNVTEYPGFLELIPSGSIDKECVGANGLVDYQSKLLSEFSEETGLPKEYIKEIAGFAFVLDVGHNVYDICCKILLGVSKETVAQRFQSNEYNEPVFVAMNDLNDFVKANAGLTVPTSMAIIEAYRQSV